MNPFQYVDNSERKYSPQGYEDYPSFKPWLRDEFKFRCVYCLFRETWYPSGNAAFGVEHFEPKSSDVGKTLRENYGNLFYACNRCNTKRGIKPLDGIKPAQLGSHLRLITRGKLRGHLKGKTGEGEVLIGALGLNSDLHVVWRDNLLWLAETFNPKNPEPILKDLFLFFFRFPKDLPDLETLRPPEGNSASTDESWFEVNKRGELPAYY